MKINEQNETTEKTVEDSYLPEISGIQPPISKAIIGKTTVSPQNLKMVNNASTKQKN
jgi:hypothetical protein